MPYRTAGEGQKERPYGSVSQPSCPWRSGRPYTKLDSDEAFPQGVVTEALGVRGAVMS